MLPLPLDEEEKLRFACRGFQEGSLEEASSVDVFAGSLNRREELCIFITLLHSQLIFFRTV